MSRLFKEIRAERKRQDKKFGEQNHLINSEWWSPDFCKAKEKFFRKINKKEDFRFSWLTVLLEEVYEAFGETDPKKQREELIQVAAVAVAIIECLDRREAKINDEKKSQTAGA
jgi:NTP pyrophosphatase (non-canonical NTP hydrolase)